MIYEDNYAVKLTYQSVDDLSFSYITSTSNVASTDVFSSPTMCRLYQW